MIRPSRVVFVSRELEDSFNELKGTDWLKKSIIHAIRHIQKNAFAGIQIPKRLFLREYVQKYTITNLWKYDLPRGWRLLYTVTADNEVELLAAILDWCDHKLYERRFRY